ncbi:MAG: NUDIX hydrolase [Cyclobacteriaceae bacterium]|nr:NUDIX hydrolase [Cyclobacteriaceae bacterium]
MSNVSVSSLDSSAKEIYGNRVRIRFCGLCWRENRLLLVNHFGLYGHDFWAPPGGGAEFGQPAAANVEREFMEETGLTVKAGSFRFGCEFIKPPLHAVELFFDVEVISGELAPGRDPERKKQIIREVGFFTEQEVRNLPADHKHGVFNQGFTFEKLRQMQGYFRI